MWHAWAFMLLATLTPCQGLALFPADDTDGAVLQALKASFSNGDQVLHTWQGERPCDELTSFGASTWRGVICNRTIERVTHVLLEKFDLVGSMPPGGYVLPASTERFLMSDNRISGTIPEGWQLPQGLVHFGLFSIRGLSGSIPALLLPDRLQTFYLAENMLTGSLPRNWALPEGLTELALSSNLLSGDIPWDAWALPDRLKLLELHDNQLTGTLPATLRLPESLTILTLNDNQLAGSLPNTTWLPPRVTLDVSGNSLTGTLPTWPDLANVTVYITPGNSFCGEVPASPVYADSRTRSPVTSLPSCTSSPGDSGSATAAIIGGVLGGIACLVTVILASWWLVRRKQRGKGIKPVDVEYPLPSSDLATGGSTHDATTSSWLDDPLLDAINSRLSKASWSEVRSANGSTSGPNSSIASAACAKAATRELGVNMSQYLICFSELRFRKQVGSGSWGRVYLASWQDTDVAVKLLMGPAAKMASVSEAAEALLSPSNAVVTDLRKETRLLAALRHPHVQCFMGLCVSPPCLVSEYCARGSLYNVLQEARASPAIAKELTWELRLNMALGAALGMLYLHSFKPPVLHRDLKSPNLLVAGDWQVKIADFNMSKIMGEGSVDTGTNSVANPFWLAPEVLRGEVSTLASDVFSFGVVLWELMTWRLPYDTIANPWQVASTVMAGGRPEIPEPEQLQSGATGVVGLSEYIQLITRCWAQNPAERPSFVEVTAALRALLSDVEQQGLTKEKSTGVGAAQGELPTPPVAGKQAPEPQQATTDAGAARPPRRCVIPQVANASPFEAMAREFLQRPIVGPTGVVWENAAQPPAAPSIDKPF